MPMMDRAITLLAASIALVGGGTAIARLDQSKQLYDLAVRYCARGHSAYQSTRLSKDPVPSTTILTFLTSYHPTVGREWPWAGRRLRARHLLAPTSIPWPIHQDRRPAQGHSRPA